MKVALFTIIREVELLCAETRRRDADWKDNGVEDWPGNSDRVGNYWQIRTITPEPFIFYCDDTVPAFRASFDSIDKSSDANNLDVNDLDRSKSYQIHRQQPYEETQFLTVDMNQNQKILVAQTSDFDCSSQSSFTSESNDSNIDSSIHSERCAKVVSSGDMLSKRQKNALDER